MNTKDFNIRDGILRKYNGPGGDVTIPEGVKEIGDEAFRFCESLTSVIVPKSVTKIGRDVFSTVRV
ncbi:MAG: leucine-rich repeat protein [Oscillibacter sp.]|nr:leucine-rich repeat protein [Oscillibacter sp.]